MRQIRPRFLLGFAPFWTALHCRHEAKLWEQIDPLLVAEISDSCGFDSHFVSTYLYRGGDDSGAQFALDELRRQPIWLQLREAMLSTRKGSVVQRDLLAAARAEFGGRLKRAVTGGSHTSAPVRHVGAQIRTTVPSPCPSDLPLLHSRTPADPALLLITFRSVSILDVKLAERQQTCIGRPS